MNIKTDVRFENLNYYFLYDNNFVNESSVIYKMNSSHSHSMKEYKRYVFSKDYDFSFFVEENTFRKENDKWEKYGDTVYSVTEDIFSIISENQKDIYEMLYNWFDYKILRTGEGVWVFPVMLRFFDYRKTLDPIEGYEIKRCVDDVFIVKQNEEKIKEILNFIIDQEENNHVKEMRFVFSFGLSGLIFEFIVNDFTKEDVDRIASTLMNCITSIKKGNSNPSIWESPLLFYSLCFESSLPSPFVMLEANRYNLLCGNDVYIKFTEVDGEKFDNLAEFLRSRMIGYNGATVHGAFSFGDVALAFPYYLQGQWTIWSNNKDFGYDIYKYLNNMFNNENWFIKRIKNIYGADVIPHFTEEMVLYPTFNINNILSNVKSYLSTVPEEEILGNV